MEIVIGALVMAAVAWAVVWAGAPAIRTVTALTEKADVRNAGRREEKNAEKKGVKSAEKKGARKDVKIEENPNALVKIEENPIALVMIEEGQISPAMDEAADLTEERMTVRSVTDAVRPVAVKRSNCYNHFHSFPNQKGTVGGKPTVPFLKRL